MNFKLTLLVLLSVALSSCQGSTETPPHNVDALIQILNKLNQQIHGLTKTVIRLDQTNNIIMTRLDEIANKTVVNDECRMQKLFNELDPRVKSIEVKTTQVKKVFVLFTSEAKSWKNAYDDCIKKNMTLASVESEEENRNLVSLLKAHGKEQGYWLSGTDVGHNGRYVWASGVRPIVYNQWREGQPDNRDGPTKTYGTAHCVSIWDHLSVRLWYDEPCAILQAYVCQRMK